MLDYLEESMYGIRGIITDSCTGDPIRAKVYANSYDQANDSSHVYSALPVGNYHKYVNTGTYSLTFSAPGYNSKTINNISVSNGTATVQNVVLVPLAPIANFTADATSTCSGVVQFSNTGTYPAGCSFLWNFGDGQTSTLENPQHTYASNGNYNVTLTINACSGNDTETKTSYIEVNMPAAPVATGATICGNGSVTLSATGSGTLKWYDAITGGNLLGTGSSFTTPVISSTTDYFVENHIAVASTNVGPAVGGESRNIATITYFDVYQPMTLVSVQAMAATAGNKTITLQDNTGTTIETQSVYVGTGTTTITLNWQIQPGTGYQLLTPANSTLYRLGTGVSYPYTAAGICSITGCDIGSTYFYSWFNWTVQGEGCSSPRTLATATVIPQTIASFSSIVNGNSVDFSNTSLNAIAYSWDFGDGQTSTQTDPTHIFSTPGTYTVTLIAIGSGSCPNDTITQQVDVTNAPNADFSAIQFCVGGTTIFTDESSIASGSIASWDWDFGDGTTHSTIQNPSHTYTDSGYYNVTLIVVSNIGFADTNTQQIYIEPQPTAAFSFTTGATGQMTYFTDETNGNGSTLIAWLWNFGDGSTSVQQNPDHVYNAEGTYWVTLVVFNDCGSDTVVQQIVIVTDGIHETENTLQLFPNPVQDNMTTLIFTSQAAETFSIRLYSSDGQIISTSTFDAAAGENRFQLRLDDVSKGMYWLELSSEQTLQRIPLIK